MAKLFTIDCVLLEWVNPLRIREMKVSDKFENGLPH